MRNGDSERLGGLEIDRKLILAFVSNRNYETSTRIIDLLHRVSGSEPPCTESDALQKEMAPVGRLVSIKAPCINQGGRLRYNRKIARQPRQIAS
jgi:hypothetical protein